MPDLTASSDVDAFMQAANKSEMRSALDLEISSVSGLQAALDAKAPLVSPSFTTPNVGVASGTTLTLTGSLMCGQTAVIGASNRGGFRSSADGVYSLRNNGNSVNGTLTLGTLTVSGTIIGTEVAAPTAPGANNYVIFAEDNGSGKTRLMVQFATGAAQQLAIEP